MDMKDLREYGKVWWDELSIRNVFIIAIKFFGFLLWEVASTS
jgi:hypothetical protein